MSCLDGYYFGTPVSFHIPNMTGLKSISVGSLRLLLTKDSTSSLIHQMCHDIKCTDTSSRVQNPERFNITINFWCLNMCGA